MYATGYSEYKINAPFITLHDRDAFCRVLGQPDNAAGGQGCTTLDIDNGWYDNGCGISNEYICQIGKPHDPLQPSLKEKWAFEREMK